MYQLIAPVKYFSLTNNSTSVNIIIKEMLICLILAVLSKYYYIRFVKTSSFDN